MLQNYGCSLIFIWEHLRGWVEMILEIQVSYYFIFPNINIFNEKGIEYWQRYPKQVLIEGFFVKFDQLKNVTKVVLKKYMTICCEITQNTF